MSPFMKKKKPGMGAELEEPDPLDMSMPPKPPRKPVVAKTTVAVSKEPMGGEAPPYRPPRSAPMEEEQAEGEDYGENFGQKLADDIDTVMANAGMDQSQGRTLAANLFSAVADCLAKAGGGGEAAPMEENEEEYS